MANRQTFPPNALFPLRGDLSAEAGATTVEVTGLQNIPIAPNPLVDGTVPTYNAANGDIEWKAGGGAGNALQIEGVNAGDLYILINTVPTVEYLGETFLGIYINGVLDGGL